MPQIGVCSILKLTKTGMVKSNGEHQSAWRGRLQAELHEAHRLERAAQRKVHGLERAEVQVKDILKLARARRGDVRSKIWKTVSLWLDKLHTARRRRHARQHPRCTLPTRFQESADQE